jgi:type I restriction enzyme M protein
MPLLEVRKAKEAILELPGAEGDLLRWNHVLEPEYHQEIYVEACRAARQSDGAFQLGDEQHVLCKPFRGMQPQYADDEADVETLEYEGMLLPSGETLDDQGSERNVCALKSISVRWGYVDFSVARSVKREFYERRRKKAGIMKGDLLINSTGDGTIGRAAIFNKQFPAVVDGHITIVRFRREFLAWYCAAYLLSDEGQRQIYRYINGSSGQVEIYPQDIARIWVRTKPQEKMKEIAKTFQRACLKHDEFYNDMKRALNMIG